MVKRYHRSVFFPPMGDALFNFTKSLNYMEWKFTDHSLDKLSDESRKRKINLFLNTVWLDPDWIFEIYLNNSQIKKACFRCSFSDEEDLILVVTESKELVTFYFNDVGDLHMDLDITEYANE